MFERAAERQPRNPEQQQKRAIDARDLVRNPQLNGKSIEINGWAGQIRDAQMNGQDVRVVLNLAGRGEQSFILSPDDEQNAIFVLD